ncbi:hypothetical protein AYO49_02170 [Verrucomicrobiaceae bacterium SCGC AG-212-N21]|nr:hypothetical protein AYO49_02170 [Verrucomicrobiaceae bacterium SCGC AG-212-N21]
MTIAATRVSTSLAAVLVAVASLIVLIFWLTGLEYFLEVLLGAVVHIAIISAVAGVVRLPFRRGGFLLSVICGASVALAGFLIVLAVAISNI